MDICSIVLFFVHHAQYRDDRYEIRSQEEEDRKPILLQKFIRDQRDRETENKIALKHADRS